MADIVTNFDLSGKNVVIQGQNNPFYGKKIGFIGDSFTYGSTLANPTTERYSKILCDKLQAKEVNVAVGGTGFVSSTNYTTNFDKQADILKSREPNIDVVIVLGGINDANRKLDIAVIAQAQAELFAKLNILFPNALICWAGFNYPPTTSDWLANMKNSGRINSFPYYDCPSVGVKILPNPTDVIKYNGAQNYSSDKIHPNAIGHRFMADVLFSGLVGGSSGDRFIFQHVTTQFESGVSGIINAKCVNNVYFVEGQLTVTSDFVLGWNPVAKLPVPLGNMIQERSACNKVYNSQMYSSLVGVDVDGTIKIQDVATQGTRYYSFQMFAHPYYNR